MSDRVLKCFQRSPVPCQFDSALDFALQLHSERQYASGILNNKQNHKEKVGHWSFVCDEPDIVNESGCQCNEVSLAPRLLRPFLNMQHEVLQQKHLMTAAIDFMFPFALESSFQRKKIILLLLSQIPAIVAVSPVSAIEPLSISLVYKSSPISRYVRSPNPPM
jgi:hypothetical protein